MLRSSEHGSVWSRWNKWAFHHINLLHWTARHHQDNTSDNETLLSPVHWKIQTCHGLMGKLLMCLYSCTKINACITRLATWNISRSLASSHVPRYDDVNANSGENQHNQKQLCTFTSRYGEDTQIDSIIGDSVHCSVKMYTFYFQCTLKKFSRESKVDTHFITGNSR